METPIPMILMSINKDTKQIHMTSFMRDLYANIPDVGVKKLNAACAYGGGPLVVRTIEDNYKLPIDNYASVDFDSMIDIIDAIGGIELSPSDDEIRVANQYVDEMCRLRNVDASAHQYTAGGERMWMAIRQLHMQESVTLEILIIRERSVSERF